MTTDEKLAADYERKAKLVTLDTRVPYSEEFVAVVEDARDTLINCWDEWEQFAGEEAQNDQDNDSWFTAMNAQIDCVLHGMVADILKIDREARK